MEGTKILVVEDDDDGRQLLVLWLQRWREGTICEATNGQEALDCIKHDRPDLTLLDLRMPVMHGWETARRTRALPAPLNRLPIIALTAQAMAADRDQALVAGCDEYITKPIGNSGEIREKCELLLTYGRPTGLAITTRQP